MSSLDVTLNAFIGFGTGYHYGHLKLQEDEVKQGKNYYNASLLQVSQMGTLSMVINRIASFVLTGTPQVVVQVISQVVPFVLIPVNFLIAAIKQKNYEEIAAAVNENRCAILPQNLSETTNAIAGFFAEYTGDIIRVAVIVGIVALIILGDIAFSAAALTALTYHVIDQLGWIPREISLFLETYLPVISLIGMLIGGTVLLQIMALLMLPNYIWPSFYQVMLEKADLLCRYFFSGKIYGPALEEINADLIERKDLTFDEINEILDADDEDYQFNPAHFSKSVIDFNKFPQDDDFGYLITAFEEIDWTKNYKFILKRLADDEIFIDLLITKYPTVSKEEFKAEIDAYIGRLADEKGVSKEKFAADWTREQMGYLVAVMKGERRVKGSQQDLAEAIEDEKRIIAYLKGLDPVKDRVDREDTLLKIALEQGDYCARGIKRAANEMRWVVVRQQLAKFGLEKTGDPIKDFELEIRQALEEQRLQKVQSVYKNFMDQIYGNFPDNIKNDVHVFDIYRLWFSLGFYPLTEYEKNQIGFMHIPTWEMLSVLRPAFYKSYKPSEAIKPVSAKFFCEYLPKVLEANSKLSPAQREEILERLSNSHQNHWSREQTERHYEQMGKNFERLMFVMLGVMRKIDPHSTADYNIPAGTLEQFGLAPERYDMFQYV